MQTSELRQTITAEYGRTRLSLAFSPDGKTLAVAYGGPRTKLIGGARLFDTRSGELIQTLLGHQHLATSLAYAPDGKVSGDRGRPA